MGRIRRLFGTGDEKPLVSGDGLKFLMDRFRSAVEEDGFIFVLIVGERGRGKSSLALNLGYLVYGSWEAVLKSLVFTVDDFDSKVSRRPRELLADDGRIRLLIWDDMGLHFSTYRWFVPHERQRMMEFVENFQTVREDTAILIATAVEPDILPPKIRNAANIIVDCYRRGKAKVYTYVRRLWLRTWKVVGEIEWSRSDAETYARYREMKRVAHRAKQKARILAKTKLVSAYAKVLESLMDRLDRELLYGLGIIDIDGNVTDFGKLVLRELGLDKEYIQKKVSREDGCCICS